MAYTNAQLLRRLIGDGGTPYRQLFSGDGTTLVFQMSPSAVIGSSETVKIAGVTKSTPGDYSIDAETARITFVVAPGAGSSNIEVLLRACELSDGDIVEALRQKGLTSSDTADIGPATAMLAAGYMLAEWVAAKYAYAYDSQVDGQALYRSQMAKQWKERAEALLKQASRASGLSEIKVTRVDGYNRQLVDSQAVNEVNVNARQRFYVVGGLDRVP